MTNTRTRGILLDVEGTTTPLSFVHEVLFPYARQRIEEYLAAHADDPDVESDLVKLRAEHAQDIEQGLAPPALADDLDSLAKYAQWLIDRDRKSAGLKSLQGKIWEAGYHDGTLRAPMFPDVLPALERWRQRGLKVAIFSSGSVLAQRLLFAHTDAGDVTPFVDDYFDTTTGPKTSGDSYRRIAIAMSLLPEEITFFSDVVPELDAAREAGMQTLLCIRHGNAPQEDPDRHSKISSFDKC